MRTGLLLGLMLLLLILTGCGRANQAPPDHCFWGVALEGYPITAARLARVEKELGFRPQLVLFYLQWPAPGGSGEFPQASLDAIWQRGAVPCLTWEPLYLQDKGEVAIPYEQILGGDYDAYLTRFARQAAAWGQPLIIRLAHEMNLKRYHWGTDLEHYGPQSPAIYQRLYRYVVDIFKKGGAYQVFWAFCPNAESLPNPAHEAGAGWNRAGNYYPGDDYVDILGMDGYNWGTTQTLEKHGWQSQWRSFQEIFGPLYKELRTLAPHKPLLVFETASVRQGGDKTAWIKDAIPVLRAWQVQGIIWFQVNKEVDWRLNAGEDLSYVSLITEATSGAQQWLKNLTSNLR
ncbi:MAG: glycosyl hydrolase [Desulfobacca sp.]|nr:glycosyl hydrolase [Desulfobacca sp.]